MSKFGTDPNFLKQRAEAYKIRKDDPSGGNRDFLFSERVPLYSVRDGENIIRVLPAGWEGAMFPWREVYVHYQIGANNGQFICTARTPDIQTHACPICEEAKRLEAAGEKQESLRPLFAQHRAIAWIIDRKDESKGPQIWVMPYAKIAQQIIKNSFKRSGEFLAVDSVKEGWDILFDKQGKGLTTKYDGFKKDDEPTPLSRDLQQAEEWLKQSEDKNIPSLLNIKSYDHIKNVLHGTLPTEESTPITSEPAPAKRERKEKVAAAASPASLSAASLENMNREQLVEFINSREELSINPDEWEEDADLAQAIALELNLS